MKEIGFWLSKDLVGIGLGLVVFLCELVWILVSTLIGAIKDGAKRKDEE